MVLDARHMVTILLAASAIGCGRSDVRVEQDSSLTAADTPANGQPEAGEGLETDEERTVDAGSLFATFEEVGVIPSNPAEVLEAANTAATIANAAENGNLEEVAVNTAVDTAANAAGIGAATPVITEAINGDVNTDTVVNAAVGTVANATGLAPATGVVTDVINGNVNTNTAVNAAVTAATIATGGLAGLALPAVEPLKEVFDDLF